MTASEDQQRTPVVLASRFNRAAAWANRYLTPFLTAIAVLGVGVMLVFTIYYTLLDLQWIAFLLGVLFAAVLSMVTQSVKAQWLLVRRTAQLRRNKELLAEQIALTERSAQAMKSEDTRIRAILDALPLMIFFVDREERCRHHNLAFEAWCGRSATDIGRLLLSDLVDEAIYRDLRTHGVEALLGARIEFEAQWPSPDGKRQVAVKLVPYPVSAQTTSGFYVFVTTIPAARAQPASGRSPQDAAEPAAPEAASQALYLDAMERQLSPDEDPREYLLRAMEEDQFMLLEQRIEPLTPEGQANFREILLRLREEDERVLAPRGFFEVAEHYDLMPAIDRWVVRRLLKSCASMKSANRAWRMPVYCINLSGATLGDAAFANHVRAQLQHWELAGSRLCFEIGHEVLAERETDIRILMEQLKPLGCLFTVDGFGSHKISFAPFRHLRFDFLKIDGSIVSEILRTPSELAKARAIVLACQKIGVQTIAQFVQDEITRAKLKEIGVDYVQGFGIHKPGPLEVVALAPPVSA
jgi:EAL domain-containing protein (putative c-di-GMP-specific phosphodiesterase class I)